MDILLLLLLFWVFCLFFIYCLFFFSFSFLFFSLLIRAYSGPRADLASETLESLSHSWRRSLECTFGAACGSWRGSPGGSTLGGACSHCKAVPSLPRFLGIACELQVLVSWLVCCGLEPEPPTLHVWDDIPCGDNSLLASVTTLFLLVFSNWVGHRFLYPNSLSQVVYRVSQGTEMYWR